MSRSLLVLALSLLLVPILFWGVSNQFNFSFSSPNIKNVKGFQTNDSIDKNGFLITVDSGGVPWELIEYLCVSEEECLESLNSGTRYGIVGGGAEEVSEIVVEYSPKWKNYPFMKFYIKPGSLSSYNVFKVLDLGAIQNSQVKVFEENGKSFEAVIMPLETVSESFNISAKFVLR